jgi:hypothetical protein
MYYYSLKNILGFRRKKRKKEKKKGKVRYFKSVFPKTRKYISNEYVMYYKRHNNSETSHQITQYGERRCARRTSKRLNHQLLHQEAAERKQRDKKEKRKE